MDDILIEFLTETNENLGQLDTALIQLEQTPDDKELLSKIFRVMHTLKSTCGFLGLSRLGGIAHHTEDMFGLIRSGVLRPGAQTISLILESLDQIKLILAGLEKSGREPDGEDGVLMAKLEAACRNTDVLPKETVAAGGTGAVPPEHALATVSANSESTVASQSLRINVDVLEELMTQVSELVLVRNQILQINRGMKDSELNGPLQRFNHIVSDLQDGVMKTRMQPIGHAWSKLPRIVRDISNDLGKKIELEMQGQDTELDRQVLDMIRDPLTHMVRNSADHGIEMPAERIAAGKMDIGRIFLNSYNEGGHIVIEIRDDGRGLSLEKIRRKILQNGLASEAELAAMQPAQIYNFIFHAGFSTADRITALSGRGVGMDVVRSNVEKIGGSVELQSMEGQGTTFRIKIPLTLAIVSALIIGVADERFAIPQLDVSELVMAKPEGVSRIETINGAPVFRLRDKLLPLVCLRKLLKFASREDEGARYIAVVHAGSMSFGIIVDRIYDTEEIVVKPVSRIISSQTVFAGNTILGDGKVIMILDSAGIMRTAGITAEAGRRSVGKDEKADTARMSEQSLLLFLAGSEGIKAIPLEQAYRLEEVPLANIESAGGQPIIQYNDCLIPIYFYDEASKQGAGRRPVIIFGHDGALSGLVVDKIIDIASHKGELRGGNGKVICAEIVLGKATDIVNLQWFANKRAFTATNTEDEALPIMPAAIKDNHAGARMWS